MVAELVLEALEGEGVAGAVVEGTRHDEAGESAGRLGQHEEDVAHRRRAEPLVAGQAVGLAQQRTTRRGDGAGRVGAHVRAALLLGHAHARDGPGLPRHGPDAEVVAPARQGGQPAGTHGRVVSQGRPAAYVIETGQPWPASTRDQSDEARGAAHVRAGPGGPPSTARR